MVLHTGIHDGSNKNEGADEKHCHQGDYDTGVAVWSHGPARKQSH